MDTDDDEACYYEVEAIRKKRILPDRTEEYLIKWKGYDESCNNTWEPEDNLNCTSILAAFKKQDQEMKKKIKLTFESNSFDLSKKDPRLSSVPNQKNNQNAQTQKNKQSQAKNQFLQSNQSNQHSAQLDKIQEAFPDYTAIKRPYNEVTVQPTIDIDTIIKKMKNNEYIEPESSKGINKSSQSQYQRPLDMSLDKESYKKPLAFETQNTHQKISGVPPKRQMKPSTQFMQDTKINFETQPHAKQYPSLPRTSTQFKQNTNTIPKVQTHSTPQLPARGHSKEKPIAISQPRNHVKTIANPQYIKNSPNDFTTEKHTDQQYVSLRSPLLSTQQVRPIQQARPNEQALHNVVESHQHPQQQKRQQKQQQQHALSSQSTSYQRENHPPSYPKEVSRIISSSRSNIPAASLPNLIPQQLVTQTINETSNYRPATLKKSSSRDPRLNLEKRKREGFPALPKETLLEPTPLSLKSVLCKGNELEIPITLIGKQKCFHKQQILNVMPQQEEPKYIHISSFLPLSFVNKMIFDKPYSLMQVEVSGSLIKASKLRSFLQINEIAGATFNSENTQHKFIFLPATDLEKLSNAPADHDIPVHQFCAIYMDDIPSCLNVDLYLKGYDLIENSPSFYQDKVALLLRFSPQLYKLRDLASFYVYGNSKLSLLLKKYTRKRSSENTILMFDRADDTLFSRPLTRHKKEALSQIWEFGMPNKPLAIIEPPEQVFPKNSGGFVTTDIRNMLIYPNIIDTICEQIEKLNKDTVSHGQWKFVLPHTIFEQFQYIRGDEKRVQEVVIKLSLELSRGRITILKLWSKSSQEMDTVDFLKSVMLNYYKKLQFFVYADDMYYVLEKNRPFCLDFVNSTDIFLTFN